MCSQRLVLMIDKTLISLDTSAEAFDLRSFRKGGRNGGYTGESRGTRGLTAINV